LVLPLRLTTIHSCLGVDSERNLNGSLDLTNITPLKSLVLACSLPWSNLVLLFAILHFFLALHDIIGKLIVVAFVTAPSTLALLLTLVGEVNSLDA
jgi:hypothetical protein